MQRWSLKIPPLQNAQIRQKNTLQMQSPRLNTKLTHIPIAAQSRKKETFKSDERQRPAIAMITVKTAVLHRL